MRSGQRKLLRGSSVKTDAEKSGRRRLVQFGLERLKVAASSSTAEARSHIGTGAGSTTVAGATPTAMAGLVSVVLDSSVA